VGPALRMVFAQHPVRGWPAPRMTEILKPKQSLWETFGHLSAGMLRDPTPSSVNGGSIEGANRGVVQAAWRCRPTVCGTVPERSEWDTCVWAGTSTGSVQAWTRFGSRENSKPACPTCTATHAMRRKCGDRPGKNARKCRRSGERASSEHRPAKAHWRLSSYTSGARCVSPLSQSCREDDLDYFRFEESDANPGDSIMV